MTFQGALVNANPYSPELAVGMNGANVNILLIEFGTNPCVACVGGVSKGYATNKEIISTTPDQSSGVRHDAPRILERLGRPGGAIEQICSRMTRLRGPVCDHSHEPVCASTPGQGSRRLPSGDSLIHLLPAQPGWRAGRHPCTRAAVNVNAVPACHGGKIDFTGRLIGSNRDNAIVRIGFRVSARKWPELLKAVA